MDLNVRAMKLNTALGEALDGLVVEVRVSQPIVSTPGTHPKWLTEMLNDTSEELRKRYETINVIVVTVRLSALDRRPSAEELHTAHEIVAKEFWEEIVRGAHLSIQVV